MYYIYAVTDLPLVAVSQQLPARSRTLDQGRGTGGGGRGCIARAGGFIGGGRIGCQRRRGRDGGRRVGREDLGELDGLAEQEEARELPPLSRRGPPREAGEAAADHEGGDRGDDGGGEEQGGRGEQARADGGCHGGRPAEARQAEHLGTAATVANPCPVHATERGAACTATPHGPHT